MITARARQNGSGERMAGAGFESGRKAHDVGFGAAEADHIGDLWLAFRQRPGFIERCRGDPADIFQDRAAFEKQAASCAGRK
jgi:hypothetical protein